jgi:hypothetical protein
MKTKAQLKRFARGVAESHFYCDDECTIPWEPFEHDEPEDIERECESLADSIFNAMLWAQSSGDQTNE